MTQTKTAIILHQFLINENWLTFFRDGNLTTISIKPENDKNSLYEHIFNSLEDIVNSNGKSSVCCLIATFDSSENSTQIQQFEEKLCNAKIIDHFEDKIKNANGIFIGITIENGQKLSWLIIKA